MNTWTRVMVVVVFIYLSTAVIYTPWMTKFPMQIFVPVIFLFSVTGLLGAMLQRLHLMVIPTLLALLLAIPVFANSVMFYACLGVANVPLTLSYIGPFRTVAHFGINLVPVALIAAFLYCLLGISRPMQERGN